MRYITTIIRKNKILVQILNVSFCCSKVLNNNRNSKWHLIYHTWTVHMSFNVHFFWSSIVIVASLFALLIYLLHNLSFTLISLFLPIQYFWAPCNNASLPHCLNHVFIYLNVCVYFFSKQARARNFSYKTY